MPSVFETILANVCTYLNLRPEFKGLDFINYKTADFDSQLSAQVAQLGIVALVTLPKAAPPAVPTATLFYDDVLISLDFVENVKFNQGKGGTGLTAFAAADFAAMALQNWVPLPDDPKNQHFVLQLAVEGIVEITSSAYVANARSTAQLNSLTRVLQLDAASDYCVVAARFRMQCYPILPVPALARLLVLPKV